METKGDFLLALTKGEDLNSEGATFIRRMFLQKIKPSHFK